MILSANCEKVLKEYLLEHEADIAWEIDDFYLLSPLFVEVFSREPNKHPYYKEPTP